MKTVSRFIASVLIVTSTALLAPMASAEFKDVAASHKNVVSIYDLQERQIVKGYDDNTFRPDVVVNRAEALKFILAGIGVNVTADQNGSSFTDVKANDWFAAYVKRAKDLGVVSGNPDGTFAPGRQVTRAEFVKMLLDASKWDKKVSNISVNFPDVPRDAWYSGYVTYAGYIGLLEQDSAGNMKPGNGVTRGDVAEMIYVLTLIIKKGDAEYLTVQAQKHIASVTDYIAAGDLVLAKRATERAVDITQQAYKSAPTNTTVVAWAKVARSYDYAIASFIAAVKKNYLMAEDYAKKSIEKANEAVATLDRVAPIADFIKGKAQEILNQIPKK